MADPRWTAATELLAAKVMLSVAYNETGVATSTLDGDWSDAEQGDRDAILDMVRRMLAALADAGLLVQPGTTSRVEWALLYPDHQPTFPMRRPVYDEAQARKVAADRGYELQSRTVHEGPWRPVEEVSGGR